MTKNILSLQAEKPNYNQNTVEEAYNQNQENQENELKRRPSEYLDTLCSSWDNLLNESVKQNSIPEP